MIISPINYTNHFARPKSFKGHYKKVYDDQGELLYRTTTFPFREDLDWTSFVNLLERKYKDTPKVHIICHACSNGAEPYSLAAKLIKVLKEKADKYLPIFAKDIDKDNIELAKKGKIEADGFEVRCANLRLGSDCSEYFDIEKIKETENNNIGYIGDRFLSPKPFLKDKVIFEQADILEDIDKLPTSNTVLMCRNMWAYIKPQQREELIRKICSHFDDTCLVVIGDFDKIQKKSDMIVGMDKVFKQHNLKHTHVNNVWEIPPK